MKRYEAPLHMISHHRKKGRKLSLEQIIPVRVLYDVMTDEELLESVAAENPQKTIGNNAFNAEMICEHVLGIDFRDRTDSMDREAEAVNLPKNFDVALSRIDEQGNIEEAARLTWFLAEHYAVADPIDKALIAEFEELADAIERVGALTPGATKRRVVIDIWNLLRQESIPASHGR